MYEHRRSPLLPRRKFLRRLAAHFAVGAGILGGSLLLGMAGYAYFEKLAWLDSFLNAAMLLGGMGPVWAPRTAGGKIFAGAYALYAGLVFLVAIAVILAPAFHRLLHRFHLEKGGGGVDNAENRRAAD